MRFKFDVFRAIESTGVELAGWRHVARKGRNLVVSSQIQDVSDDILSWEVTPEGRVTFVGREPAFAE